MAVAAIGGDFMRPAIVERVELALGSLAERVRKGELESAQINVTFALKVGESGLECTATQKDAVTRKNVWPVRKDTLPFDDDQPAKEQVRLMLDRGATVAEAPREPLLLGAGEEDAEPVVDAEFHVDEDAASA